MKHAILIVDMPESINGETPCKHCSLHVAEYDDYYHHYVCQGIQTFDFDGNEWGIYNKCPLKPLVDVIPIEWILKWACEFVNPNSEGYKMAMELVHDWEKENES